MAIHGEFKKDVKVIQTESGTNSNSASVDFQVKSMELFHRGYELQSSEVSVVGNRIIVIGIFYNPKLFVPAEDEEV